MQGNGGGIHRKAVDHGMDHWRMVGGGGGGGVLRCHPLLQGGGGMKIEQSADGSIVAVSCDAVRILLHVHSHMVTFTPEPKRYRTARKNGTGTASSLRRAVAKLGYVATIPADLKRCGITGATADSKRPEGYRLAAKRDRGLVQERPVIRTATIEHDARACDQQTSRYLRDVDRAARLAVISSKLGL